MSAFTKVKSRSNSGDSLAVPEEPARLPEMEMVIELNTNDKGYTEMLLKMASDAGSVKLFLLNTSPYYLYSLAVMEHLVKRRNTLQSVVESKIAQFTAIQVPEPYTVAHEIYRRNLNAEIAAYHLQKNAIDDALAYFLNLKCDKDNFREMHNYMLTEFPEDKIYAQQVAKFKFLSESVDVPFVQVSSLSLFS